MDSLNNLTQSLNNVLRGQESVIELTVAGLLADGHILLEGAPGLGKTLLLSSLARLVDLDFKRIQFTPDLMPADITGTRIVEDDENGRKQFRFEPGPVFTNLLLADEINRATPKTQSALLEAMQERQVTAGGERRPLPSPFFVMATQNPIEQEGTYPLPEAQLDRFLMKVTVGQPNAGTISNILKEDVARFSMDLSPVMTPDELNEVRAKVKEVPIASHVYDYMACLVQASHPSSDLQSASRHVMSGSSPRGALALRDVSRALAFLRGQDHVGSGLIREIAPAVLAHRIVLGFEARADGITAPAVIHELLDQVPDAPQEVGRLVQQTT